MRLKVQQNDSILIVAPHPDDETLGCGGLLLKSGSKCDVLLITDGRQGFFESCSVTDPEKVALIRKKEFLSVMDCFGVNGIRCLDLPNENLQPSIKVIRRFNLRKYTKIFIPGRKDHHQEHIIVNRVLRQMIVAQWCKAQVFEYEVWTPLQNPNCIFDISDVMEQKIEALSIYKSQMECYNYVGISKGLNGYRGCTHQVAYAEAYYHWITPREALRNVYRKIKK